MKNFFVTCSFILCSCISFGQFNIEYTVSFAHLKEHSYHVKMEISNVKEDSLLLQIPNWMPGYYQLMPYANGIKNLSVSGQLKKAPVSYQRNNSSWAVHTMKNKKIVVEYDVATTRKFVANSYVDENHAYLIAGNSFLYIAGLPAAGLQVKLEKPLHWEVATGLKPAGVNTYSATDFDMLYDCPILLGPLEHVPGFKVKNINHRFLGYKMGEFNKEELSNHLQRIVTAASDIIGDIPYDEYSFIAIGPGNGGIEHLNNTTVSFSGTSLSTPEGRRRMYSFLAHEYFHHYNVKRIRPYELGPFDYQTGNRSTQLWISEGLTVYYEYLILKRAGLVNEEELLQFYNNNLNSFENDPGRHFQSLIEASYQTWEEGPFGERGKEDRSISYYQKGPLVGMLLDFEIRNSTQNKSSLDDVMRKLYYSFYKEKQRGFTDAEFREVCEVVAGKSLEDFFRYIYTAEPLNYNKYLGYAGLEIQEQNENDKKKWKILKLNNTTAIQKAIYKSWASE